MANENNEQKERHTRRPVFGGLQCESISDLLGSLAVIKITLGTLEIYERSGRPRSDENVRKV
jgi:hypothetical protein